MPLMEDEDADGDREGRVIVPEVVILSRAPLAVNQIAPSGPAAMAYEGASIEYSVITPFTVIRPIFGELLSVNQRAPSGPAVIL